MSKVTIIGIDLSGFAFAASKINEATVRTLHRCEFMEAAGELPFPVPVAIAFCRAIA